MGNAQSDKPIKTIIEHKKQINVILTFPSGNIISISNDKSINIYNINLNIIQKIENAHENNVFGISIQNENNFATCSDDLSIKIWIKRRIAKFNINKFFLYGIIYNAHNDRIYNIIYSLNGNIISCSGDKTLKIWEKKKNRRYQLITIIKNFWKIFSILLLEDKEILISSEVNGINFYNIKTIELLFIIKETCCNFWNSLKRIDEDRIILGGLNLLMTIISIKERKIIRKIKNELQNWGILTIQNKKIIVVGENNNIKIYSSENYECIKKIENAHTKKIYGFCELKNETILSYSPDKVIKIWKI